MIDDDADPDTLDAWYRRTPDQIAAEQAAKWNAGWNALRTPDDQAYEYDPAPSTGGDDTGPAGDVEAAQTGDAVDAVAKTPPPEKTAWAPRESALLDVLASHEVPDVNDTPRYNVMASQPGQPLRYLPTASDGQPDYSRHPNDLLKYVNKAGKTVKTTAAGRYQINKETWDGIVAAHPDVTDFSKLNQDKAAWYLADHDCRKNMGGRDLSSDLADERYWPQIAQKLSGTWASLPGVTPSQMTQDEFNARLRAATARYTDAYPDN